MTPTELVFASVAGVAAVTALILALAVWAAVTRQARRLDDAEHRALTAERRLQLRDEQDRIMAAHRAHAAEHPTVPIPRTPGRRDWRDVG